MGERVLVVDDDLTVADVVRRYLERDGYKVLLAADGEKALRLAGEHEPDLVRCCVTATWRSTYRHGGRSCGV